MKLVRYPLAPKALQAVNDAREKCASEVSRPFDMQHINDLAGWDADAKFAQARASFKVEANVPISHRFVGDAGVLQHEFSCQK